MDITLHFLLSLRTVTLSSVMNLGFGWSLLGYRLSAHLARRRVLQSSDSTASVWMRVMKDRCMNCSVFWCNEGDRKEGIMNRVKKSGMICLKIRGYPASICGGDLAGPMLWTGLSELLSAMLALIRIYLPNKGLVQWTRFVCCEGLCASSWRGPMNRSQSRLSKVTHFWLN
jgi:hypothetical protein